MLRPCQWLEGTDIIKASAPHRRERGGNCGLVAGSDNTAVLILSENTWVNFFLCVCVSHSSVHLLISGCYQRAVWSLWFNVGACESTLRNGNLLVLSVVMQGLHRQPRQPLCTQQERSLQPGMCVIFYWGAGEGRNRQVHMRLPGQWGFLFFFSFFYCYFAVLFSLQKVNWENKNKYFHWHSLFFWTGIHWLAIGDVHLKILP